MHNPFILLSFYSAAEYDLYGLSSVWALTILVMFGSGNNGWLLFVLILVYGGLAPGGKCDLEWLTNRGKDWYLGR